MKKITAILIPFLLFLSCGSSNKKQNDYKSIPRKYISIVDDVNNYCVAYTEDGHTILYKSDSVGNNIVYYAKYENNAGEDGLRFFDEKIVRVEMDSSLTTLKSFLSFTGGAFCETKDNGYSVFYFDEQMNGVLKENVQVIRGTNQLENSIQELKLKKILIQLDVAFEIAHSISEANVSGWNNLYFSLEPIQSILSHETMIIHSINEMSIKKRVLRMCCMAEVLTERHYILHEKAIILNDK